MPVLAAIPAAIASIGATGAGVASGLAAGGAVAAGASGAGVGASIAAGGAWAAAAPITAASAGGIAGTGVGVGTAVSAVSGAGSLGFGLMQQAKTQQMYKEQEARQVLMAQRQQMDTIKQARVATGQATQNAANQGAINTSASEGGIGGIQSALTGNLDYLTRFNNFSDAASSDSQSASIFGSASKLGSTIFDEQQNGSLF